jgi:uncharacterized glyoxalase superfamily protein PhnB
MSTNSPVPDGHSKQHEPESFRARTLSASLTVKDLDKSLVWYGAKGWDRVKGEGFSLLITTDQNVDEIANRIKELGGTLESEPADMPSGGRMFRLQDPDGFKLAISSPIRP